VVVLVDVEGGVDEVAVDDRTGRSVVEGDADPLPPPQAVSADPATTKQATTPAVRCQRLRGAPDRLRRARSCLSVSRTRALVLPCGLPFLLEFSFM
jgi:hypothetical protein